MTIGTMALILVLSVFNGFEGLVKSLYSSFYPDIKISPATGKVMRLTAEQLHRLRAVPGVKNYSLVVEEKAILQNNEDQSLVSLKGVDANYSKISGVTRHMVGGRFDIGNSQVPRMVLGAGIEGALGVIADPDSDPLTIYIPRRNGSESLDLASHISSDTIRSSGAFVIQQDFDNKYAITNIGFLKNAMGLGANEYSAAEILVTHAGQTKEIQQRLQTILGKGYLIQDRYQQNQSLYGIMNTERWVFYAVLCLILVVAAFNMIGTLTMLVLEKQKDISILNALGARRDFIMRIFLNEGFLLALIGGGAGLILAVVIVLLQQQFHFVPLQGGSFLIDYFPVELRFSDFFLVGVTVFVIALLSSVMPALKASQKVFSLRSE